MVANGATTRENSDRRVVSPQAVLLYLGGVKMQRLISGMIGLLAGLLAGCNGWDTDLEYVPRLQTEVFITKSPTGYRLLRYRNASLDSAWQNDFNLVAPVALALEGEDLWVADSAARRLLKLRLPEGTLQEQVQYDGRSPVAVDVGAEYVIVGLQAESGTHRLEFRPRAGRNRLTRYRAELAQPPRFVRAVGGLVFVAGAQHAAIWSEDALATFAAFDLPGEAFSLEVDDIFNGQLLVRSTAGNLAYTLSWTQQALTGGQLTDKAVDQLTPFFDIGFGDEFLRNISVDTTARLRVPGNLLQEARPVSSCRVDFFASRMFYTVPDTLVLFDLKNAETIQQLPFHARLLTSQHYYAP